jgi:hypothetical protein
LLAVFIIEALKVFKDEVAESKGQFSSAFRESEQGYGRGGRGNASGSGEQGVIDLHLAGLTVTALALNNSSNVF